MSLRDVLRHTLDRVLASRGLVAVEPESLYEWQRQALPSVPSGALTSPADDFLRHDNPELLALQHRYAQCDAAVVTPLVWRAGLVGERELRDFRGHNAYVWQSVGNRVRHNLNPVGHVLAYYYLKTRDSLGLLDRLVEDGAFGAVTLEVDGRLISRDLLDAVGEIYFLERHLRLSTMNGCRILDIGAGYGRLAHRVVQGLPSVAEYLCADGVPASTFLCDYYLRYRGVQGRARSVPLDEVERLVPGTIDLAVNIHSFSECRMAAVAWWLDLLRRLRVRHLMIIPNTVEGAAERLLTNDGSDMRPLVEARGFRLVASEPKYGDPMVQQYAVNPARHFLFELR